MTTKTFCVLPWVHAATRTNGKVGLCCVAAGDSKIDLNQQTLGDYWNSDYLKNTRLKMLAGENVNACKRCYVEESHGYNSHRMVENLNWKRRLGDSGIQKLIHQTEVDGTLNESWQYIDLRLGNTCNLQCVMCQPLESSQWRPLSRQLSEDTNDQTLKHRWRYMLLSDQRNFEWYRSEEFWANLKTNLPQIKLLQFAGGEPLLIKEHFDFLKTCCESGESGHIKIQYNTNGTVFPREFIPYWKQFEEVIFMISLDGIGEVANYVRFPCNWEEVQKNIFEFDRLGENTRSIIHFTAHALNIFRLPEVLDWADESNLRNRKFFPDSQEFVCTSLVYNPDYQNVRVLPTEFKKIVTEKLSNFMETRLNGQKTGNLTAILDHMNSANETDKLSGLIEYTRVLDRARGTNFLDVFPELAPFWES